MDFKNMWMKLEDQQKYSNCDFKAFALTGRLVCNCIYPRALPWEGTEKVPLWVMLV